MTVEIPLAFIKGSNSSLNREASISSVVKPSWSCIDVVAASSLSEVSLYPISKSFVNAASAQKTTNCKKTERR